MAFVITGNPGVGKHTIARRVADQRGLKTLDLNQIAVRSGIAERAGETLDVDVEILRNVLGGEVSENALVVGHLAPYVVDRSQVELAVILRKNPYKLDHTYKRRGYSESKIIQNQGSEILGIIAHDATARFGQEKTVQIDTSDRPVGETVRMVGDAMEGNPRQDAVDWLGMVSCRGDMGRFFPTD